MLICFLITVLLLAAATAQAQLGKVHRIGFVGASSASAYASFLKSLQQGLRDLGYLEGKNIITEYRYGEGKFDRLPTFIAELIELGVDIIVVSGARAISEAKTATRITPVVMTTVDDPVALGLIESLARPGGNITGLTNLAPELSGKRLELLLETVPKLTRVFVVWQPDAPGPMVTFKETRLVAETLRVQLQSLEVRTANDFEKAFKEATRETLGALLVLQSALTNAHRIQIVQLAAKSRLPAMYTQNEYVEAGGLMSYSPNYNEMYRRAATYVDKILKGAKPGDLPVEQPTRFELVINLKTAKQIGLAIPPNVLARADRVIR
jgi:putative ABC transport system substrate-binding protein